MESFCNAEMVEFHKPSFIPQHAAFVGKLQRAVYLPQMRRQSADCIHGIAWFDFEPLQHLFKIFLYRRRKIIAG